MNKLLYPFLLLAVCCTACNDGPANNDKFSHGEAPTIPAINYTVVNALPHDTSFFTEGLEFYKGQLFESSGGDYEASPFPSAVGVVNTQTGKNDIKIELDKSRYFGEGITFFNDKLYVLTWKSRVGFVYDATTFKKIREFPLPAAEGWGMTHDSASLIMSDGSSNLYYLSPETLGLQKIVSVKDHNGPVANINELEYINGYIYANQWLTSYILKIDPASGQVVGRLDLTPLAKEVNAKAPYAESLNGIAYDAASGKLYVTGKKWPSLYEISLQ